MGFQQAVSRPSLSTVRARFTVPLLTAQWSRTPPSPPDRVGDVLTLQLRRIGDARDLCRAAEERTPCRAVPCAVEPRGSAVRSRHGSCGADALEDALVVPVEGSAALAEGNDGHPHEPHSHARPTASSSSTPRRHMSDSG
mmetsp:Transcript_16029/g.64692  ORF Transcript_16029/g.64692 Transcript_16029/m.64692 type:complete len:140 (+) Transcript_16029:275-694(+)